MERTERSLTRCRGTASYRVGPSVVIVTTHVIATGWLTRAPRPLLKVLAWLIAWCTTRGPLRIQTLVEVFSAVPVRIEKIPPDQPAPIPWVAQALAASQCPKSN